MEKVNNDIQVPIEVANLERWLPEEYGQDIAARYGFVARHCSNKVVLDAGCGVGFGIKILINWTKKIFGSDHSFQTLKYAQRRYVKTDAPLAVMDLQSTAFKDGIFDVVLAIEVFEHIREWKEFLFEVRRILKPKGLFIMSTPNLSFWRMDKIGLQTKDNPYHVNMTNYYQLKKRLSNVFVDVRIFGIRSKRERVKGFIRSIDLLNLRLLIPKGLRSKLDSKNKFTKYPEKLSNSRNYTNIEILPVQFGKIHTSNSFIVFCKKC